METQFYILLSLKTPGGFENYGQYSFGNDRPAAHSLFDELLGSEMLGGSCLLHVDLMEIVNELPVKNRTKCCTLEELATNSKLIAREIFRQKNFRAYDE